MSTGDFPESLSQGILVGTILVGRLGVLVYYVILYNITVYHITLCYNAYINNMCVHVYTYIHT